ncbi:MAG: DUF1549 domain-containing protein [Phycisphaerales bacterium]
MRTAACILFVAQVASAQTIQQPMTLPDPLSPASFAPGDETALIARRTARLMLMPAAPAVPDMPDAGSNPIDRFLLAAESEDGGETRAWVACSDSVFLRRVYLDLIGVTPTLEESSKFLADASPDKRAKLIDALLMRNEDYADHWTVFWEDALASTPHNSNGGMATHGDYTAFIRKAFVENRPYDVFVAQMLDPALPGYKKPERGGVNGGTVRAHIVLNETPMDRLQSAAAISQVFLGTAMKCATCHNHFENTEWPQDRFFGFASFFGTGDMEVVRCEKKLGRSVGAVFPFPIEGAPDQVPADENGRMTRVSQLLTDPLNPRFAGSIVNRLWKRYMGQGLIEPADDWREEWPASNPELLAWLADDFSRGGGGYDLKRTIRLIMNSRAYQAAYDPTLEEFFDIGDPLKSRHFRSPSLRRLTAEQLIDSVRVGLSQQLDPKARLYHSQDSTGLSRALGRAATRNEVSTGRSDQTSVVQGLELLNGEEFAGLLKKGPLVTKAVASDGTGAASLIYRAMLCREPSDAERAAVASYLGDKVTEEGVQDVLWAVVSGPEFQFIR